MEGVGGEKKDLMNKISPDFQLFFFFFILFCFSFNECQEVSLKLALAGVRTSVWR